MGNIVCYSLKTIDRVKKEVSQMKENMSALKCSVRQVLLENFGGNVNIICGDVNAPYVITICPSFMDHLVN